METSNANHNCGGRVDPSVTLSWRVGERVLTDRLIKRPR